MTMVWGAHIGVQVHSGAMYLADVRMKPLSLSHFQEFVGVLKSVKRDKSQSSLKLNRATALQM